MGNHTPAISDTLFVLESLRQAKDEINLYGGNIAEVYVKHLLPPKVGADDEKRIWTLAGQNLYTLLKDFCVQNGVYANVNGQLMGDWLNSFEIRSKCDVRIYKTLEKPMKKTKKGKHDG